MYRSTRWRVFNLLVWLSVMAQTEGQDEYPLDKLFERGVEEAQMENETEQKLPGEGRIEDKDRADVRFGVGASDPFMNYLVRITHQVQIPIEFVYREVDPQNVRNVSKGPVQREVERQCAPPLYLISCDPKYCYRTINGTCNNLQTTIWGSSLTCYRRLVQPVYDGPYEFRKSVNGSPLPNPRIISEIVHYSSMAELFALQTHIFTFFGQFIAHDCAAAAQVRTSENKAIQCCPEAPDVHPHCAPISISPDDRFYSKHGTTCMNFMRSAFCSTCQIEARRQINEVTSFFDLSLVYGSNYPLSETLRENDGTGTLKSQHTRYGELLPISSDQDIENDPCIKMPKKICYKTGDSRANQHSSLTAIHTLFLREHNRIARALRSINILWNEETLFQETRRIVIAEFQHIIYSAYLPAIIRPEYMCKFRLSVLRRGTTKHDPEIMPAVFTEFSTAAFRFGHTMVAHRLFNRNFSEDFFQVAVLQEPGTVDYVLDGITRSPAGKLDRILVTDVKEMLYRFPEEDMGIDLAAIDIQRGRDHGVPSYAQMYAYPECSHNGTLNSFEDLINYGLMKKDVVNLLKSTYADVRDIDLWTGILAESSDNFLGPVGSCIFGLQFYLLKYGDRFYYEHGGQPGSFNALQLKAIRRVTLSGILCANTNATQMPKNVFFKVSDSNPLVYCNKLPPVNLFPWLNPIPCC